PEKNRNLMIAVCKEILAPGADAEVREPDRTKTRLVDFDNADHPFRKWWEEHGQYMMAGGGRKESIWAARGWIAREQLILGKEVTGESLDEIAANYAESQRLREALREFKQEYELAQRVRPDLGFEPSTGLMKRIDKALG